MDSFTFNICDNAPNANSSIDDAYQDHYFDVVTNIVGLVAAILGDKFYWWIDPVGAIVLAFYTISNWSGTVLENAGCSFCTSCTSTALDKYKHNTANLPECYASAA